PCNPDVIFSQHATTSEFDALSLHDALPIFRTEVVPFTAADGMPLNLHHVTGERPASRGPVLLVHGAGVRANIFRAPERRTVDVRSEEHTSELQSQSNLVCRLLLEKKNL